MADSKHTPGPWKVDKKFATLRQPCEVMGEGHSVAVVTYQPMLHDTPEEAEANAHLIAAAPEMYEALKEAHRYFRNRPGNEEVQLAETLGAAIAKAEGRQ